MKCLSWSTDCNVTLQWIGQGVVLIADKSSAALNKQTSIDTDVKVNYTVFKWALIPYSNKCHAMRVDKPQN